MLRSTDFSTFLLHISCGWLVDLWHWCLFLRDGLWEGVNSFLIFLYTLCLGATWEHLHRQTAGWWVKVRLVGQLSWFLRSALFWRATSSRYIKIKLEGGGHKGMQYSLLKMEGEHLNPWGLYLRQWFKTFLVQSALSPNAFDTVTHLKTTTASAASTCIHQ